MASTDFSDFYEHTTVAPGTIEGNAITTDTILTTIYLLIGAASVLSNTFVVVVIFTSTSMMKSVTNTLIINQSFVDGLTGILLIAVTLSNDDGSYRSGLYDEIYCRVWLNNVPFWACMMGSSCNLMAITLERLISVWKPIWHKVSFTRNKVILLMILCWIIGPAVAMSYGIVSTSIIDGHCLPFVEKGLTSKVIGGMMIFLQYVLPVIVFITSYTAIVIILRAKQRQLQQETTSQTQRNVIKTMALVCLCFVLCWTINQAYFFSVILGKQVPYNGALYHFSVVIVFANCACNPFVYIFKYREFQLKVKNMFCRCKKGSKIQPLSNASTGSTV